MIEPPPEDLAEPAPEDDPGSTASTVCSRKRAYSVAFKLEVLAYAKSTDDTTACKHFKLGDNASYFRAVKQKDIFRKALQLYNAMKANSEIAEKVTFDAYKGWYWRFCRRYGLVLRRRTTLAQKVPADLQTKLVSFIIYLRRQLKETG